MNLYIFFSALLKINHKRNALSALILTQQRCTCKILYNILKDVKETNPVEFGFLQHDFIVGFNINPLTHTREQYYTKKLSLQALLKFKNGYVYILHICMYIWNIIKKNFLKLKQKYKLSLYFVKKSCFKQEDKWYFILLLSR